MQEEYKKEQQKWDNLSQDSFDSNENAMMMSAVIKEENEPDYLEKYETFYDERGDSSELEEPDQTE